MFIGRVARAWRVAGLPASRYSVHSAGEPFIRAKLRCRSLSSHASKINLSGRRIGIYGLAASGLTLGYFSLIPAKRIHNDSDMAQLSDTTLEEEMLLESDEERRDRRFGISKDRSRFHRICRTIKVKFLIYIYEPVATCFRFVQLAAIFIPVIISCPAVFLGAREPGEEDTNGAIWWYGLLTRQMESAGPTFIKLGQWAASRTDIFPTRLCEILSKLHSNVDAHKMRYSKRTIEEAFDYRAFGEIFEEFEETPIGVGAIAQVYKAKLKQNLVPSTLRHSLGSKKSAIRETLEPLVKQTPESVPTASVAIKVLHPGVERVVLRDLRILSVFANIINLVPSMEWLSVPDEVAKFGEMMRLQLDLRIEANNLTVFRSNFVDRSTVTFPNPYQAYSTRTVLIEEFAHGLPLKYFLEIGGGVYNKSLAYMGLDAFLRMLLLDNFVHADLHPGNIIVRFYHSKTVSIGEVWKALFQGKENAVKQTIVMDNGVTDEAVERLKPFRSDPQAWLSELDRLDSEGFIPQLIFIDAGLVTELNKQNRKNFLDLFTAIASYDGYHAGELMVERCRQPDAVIDEEVFALKLQNLVLSVKKKTFSLGQIKLGDILNNILSMVRNHHVRMEGDFINVVLSILLLEGIGRQLDPSMDLFQR